MRDILILNAQAWAFRGTGLAWLAIGIGLGHDPATVALRALGAAVAVLLATGILLRVAADSLAGSPAGSKAGSADGA